MTFWNSIITFFQGYPLSISFIGSFFGGEEIILPLAYLAGQSVMPLWKVFVGCLVGTLVSDLLWFHIARARWVDRLLNTKYLSKGQRKIISILDVSTRHNLFMTMLFLKFAYGTRLITISYLSREKLDMKEFVRYNFFVIFIWISVIVPLGWLAGKGLSMVTDIYHDVEMTLSAIIMLIVIVYFTRIALNRWLLKHRRTVA